MELHKKKYIPCRADLNAWKNDFEKIYKRSWLLI
jgi:hypothetical protein